MSTVAGQLGAIEVVGLTKQFPTPDRAPSSASRC